MRRREARAPSQRQLRVGEEIRHALAWILERGDVRDPGLAGPPVTVTEVRLGPDLRIATVYVTRLGGGDISAVLDALNRARPFLRRRMAASVKLKFVSDLVFRSDTTFDRAARIDTLLRDSQTGDAEAGDDGA